jgi:hypothetical protein
MGKRALRELLADAERLTGYIEKEVEIDFKRNSAIKKRKSEIERHHEEVEKSLAEEWETIKVGAAWKGRGALDRDPNFVNFPIKDFDKKLLFRHFKSVKTTKYYYQCSEPGQHRVMGTMLSDQYISPKFREH